MLYDIKWVREQVAQLQEEWQRERSASMPADLAMRFIQLDLTPAGRGDWHASYHKGHSGCNPAPAHLEPARSQAASSGDYQRTSHPRLRHALPIVSRQDEPAHLHVRGRQRVAYATGLPTPIKRPPVRSSSTRLSMPRRVTVAWRTPASAGMVVQDFALDDPPGPDLLPACLHLPRQRSRGLHRHRDGEDRGPRGRCLRADPN